MPVPLLITSDITQTFQARPNAVASAGNSWSSNCGSRISVSRCRRGAPKSVSDFVEQRISRREAVQGGDEDDGQNCDRDREGRRRPARAEPEQRQDEPRHRRHADQHGRDRAAHRLRARRRASLRQGEREPEQAADRPAAERLRARASQRRFRLPACEHAQQGAGRFEGARQKERAERRVAPFPGEPEADQSGRDPRSTAQALACSLRGRGRNLSGGAAPASEAGSRSTSV